MYLIGKHSPGGSLNYTFSLKAAIAGGYCQTIAVVPLGLPGQKDFHQPSTALQTWVEFQGLTDTFEQGVASSSAPRG